MKICSSCKENKADSDFNKNQFKCKECKAEYYLKTLGAERRIRGLHRQNGVINPEAKKRASKNWYYKNKIKVAVYSANWAKRNQARVNAAEAKRRFTKKRATPIWADNDLINAIYLKASHQNMEVDHIIPLTSKTVCGLHWEGNMQLLTKSENCSKSNRYLSE
jgi:hypothetical protein